MARAGGLGVIHQFTTIQDQVNEIKKVVNNKEKIVWLSEPMVLYLTGEISYYPLINHLNFYKPHPEVEAVKSLGFWNEEMMRGWLQETDLLVVDQNKMRGLLKNEKTRSLNKLVNDQIDTNFEKLEITTDIWPGKLNFYQPLDR